MIQVKKFSVENHYFKTMIYGKSWSWKTTLASTAPKPLYICTENWLASIASKQPEYIETKTLVELEAVYDYLKKWVNYETIIIDSISEIWEAIKSYLTDDGKKHMSMREWWVYGDKMMNIIRNIINLPYHVVAIVHESINIDDDGNVNLYDIAVQWGARSNIPRYFDVVAYTFLKGEDHKATCKPNEKLLTKDRLNCLPEDLPLDINEWIESFKRTVNIKKKEVVAEIEVDRTKKAIEAINSIDFKKNPEKKESFEKMIKDSAKYTEEEKEALLLYLDNKAI